MSPRVGARVGVGRGFPRVSGDEPQSARPGGEVAEFSPRERG